MRHPGLDQEGNTQQAGDEHQVEADAPLGHPLGPEPEGQPEQARRGESPSAAAQSAVALRPEATLQLLSRLGELHAGE